MQKLATVLVLSTALVAAASAQTYGKIDKPLSAELGVYLPTFSGGGKSVGVDVGLGYDIYKYHAIMVTPVLRYQEFSTEGTTINLYSYGAEANYRKDKYSAGIGLLGATAEADSDSVTKFAYSVQAAYSFTTKISAFVRYQSLVQGGNNGYEAVTVGVGYRF